MIKTRYCTALLLCSLGLTACYWESDQIDQGNSAQPRASLAPKTIIHYSETGEPEALEQFTYQSVSEFDSVLYTGPGADEIWSTPDDLADDLAGQARFGPDVEWIEHRDYQVNSARLPHFEEAIRRYWPDLNTDRLSPAYTGIRPKLFIKGEPYRDFLLQGEKEHGIKGMINLLGIESPGLTAALAIAEDIAKHS